MKISRNKTTFTRFVTAMISTIMLMVVFSFSAVSVMAMAADEAQAVVTVAELPMADTTESLEVTPLDDITDGIILDTYISEMPEEPHFEMLANGGNNNGNAASGSTTADGAYSSVINFFITWLRRIGAIVALVGAIMFGLAIKTNDADQKQNGLLTMVAGFVVFAVCQAADMFDLFT
ncbi:MAG: hypothetical protein K2K89_04235 [Ruminococcus sp.]|nr:hypothetical protein [Ruminococcus sp.]